MHVTYRQLNTKLSLQDGIGYDPSYPFRDTVSSFLRCCWMLPLRQKGAHIDLLQAYYNTLDWTVRLCQRLLIGSFTTRETTTIYFSRRLKAYVPYRTSR